MRSFIERTATSKKYAPLVKQIKKFWCGLFYTYDHDPQDKQRHGAIHLGAQKKGEKNDWLHAC